MVQHETADPGLLSEEDVASRPLLKDPVRAITRSYESPVIRLYCKVRFTILRQPFLEEIGQYLPHRGRVLDLGCGFGLFSLYFAASAPERRITGIDLNARRVEFARKSAAKLGLGNVCYEAGDVLEWDSRERFDAIYLLDLVHHLPAAQVPPFLAKVRARLKEGGVLVVKDVAPTPRYKMLFTLILDRLMVGMEPIRYWPPRELAAVLQRLGFEVVKHRMTDILPYPHILYVCRLKS
jgi:2-polyprenyl-3-methyl-5-hydroxy-6-metoxy-1,4-benzoquinol methylase